MSCRSDNLKTGVARAPHRSLLKALGFVDEEMGRPVIGIANSFNEIIPGHVGLKNIVQAVKDGIRNAGGVPIEFNTIGICDGLAMNHIGMKYSLVTRNIIADSIEATAMATPFDAMVFIPNCDKVVPGMLIAAARLNIPSVFVSGGAMLAGVHKGKKIGLSDVFEAVGKHQTGEMGDAELADIENTACPTCGSCSGMYTANTMNCLTEALGMGLPGNGTIPAVYSERLRLAKLAGMQAVEVLKANLRPKDIMTREAFENAVALDMALGGSSNTALHLPAIAHEAGVPLSLDDFDRIAQNTPQLSKLSPSGVYFIEDLYAAGGVSAVLKRLAENGRLHTDCKTVALKTQGEIAAAAHVVDEDVIHPWDNPVHETGGIAVLKGNLAVDGSVVKAGAVDADMLVHSGPAKVFNSEEEAVEAARKIGFPVLVRPSYVLGGRAMEIVENEDDLRSYMRTAVKASPDHPVLVDSYIIGRECEVDAISDGKDVLIPGIMEHIERAGVHSGDSMAVYPPQTLSKKIQETIADYTKRLAIGLNCIGMMNIQFVIKDETVYVIEVNPRASRTVPFLSKVTDIPMAQVATNLILGKSLAEQGYKDGLYSESNHVHVKAPVFSFTKLAKVDSLLGPEMKSTGEVMGTDATLEKALYKAFEASYLHLPTFGNVIFTIHDDTKEEALDLARRFDAIGYGIYATEGTAKFLNEHGVHATLVNKLGENDDNDIPALVRTGKAQAIINTVGNKRTYDEDGAAIRSSAIEAGIPLFTALDTADAMVRVLESRSFTTEAI